MFDIYINDNFFMRELEYKKAFSYAILASLTIPTDRVKILEKRWNFIFNKIENINYNIQRGIVYNDKNEFIYSSNPQYKKIMKDKADIREVYRLAEYLHKTNNVTLHKKYALEYWYSLSISEVYQIEKELEQTIPLSTFITRLKTAIQSINLYTDDESYSKIFSMKLNDIVIKADEINRKYPELDLKSLIHLE